ncbi:hypothetical protein BurJ1DRAFT_2281 [Burkholderiales bacterium JOSHI_001]|nr:hypothetical protein BurJ1DRAFT_2281 [Burkholderiales bacterium JOSHI_001]
MRELTPLEARVLGVLVEKQATVPDTYPLSLNSLVAGCNQKTARDPVINATESDVQVALDGLRSISLVFESSGGRVTRWEHNAARGLIVPADAAALLAVLMLRGPQTAAELRANVDRLHRFADVAAVETVLQALAERSPPRALKLPRAPGAREARWAHLLCGEAAIPAQVAAAPGAAVGDDSVSAGELAALKAQQAHMAEELADLRSLVQRMARELGVATDATPNSPEA